MRVFKWRASTVQYNISRGHRQRHEDTFTSLSGGKKGRGCVALFLYLLLLLLLAFVFIYFPVAPAGELMPYVAFTPISSLSWLFLITSFEEIVRSKTPREKKGKKEKQKNSPSKRWEKAKSVKCPCIDSFTLAEGCKKTNQKGKNTPKKQEQVDLLLMNAVKTFATVVTSVE